MIIKNDVYRQQSLLMFKKVPHTFIPDLEESLHEQVDAELSSGRSTIKGNLDFLLFQS